MIENVNNDTIINDTIINDTIINDTINNDTINNEHIKPIINKKKPSNKRRKLSNDVIIIPTFDNYDSFLNHKFTAIQLKSICKYYSLSIVGNKRILTSSIYKHLYLSFNSSIIQRFWRKHYVKRYAKLHGPASFKRHLCINETDFFTMDDIKDIPYIQFFSYKDSDNMIYGFDIMSLYNLFSKTDKYNNNSTDVLNPYTRNPISNKVKRDFKGLLFLSKLLKEDIHLIMNEQEENKSITNNNNNNNNNEYRTVQLFNEIDNLGNYTNPMWFLELHRDELLVYIRELYDIWMYRAQLTDQLKNDICPAGNPFNDIHLNDLPSLSLRELQYSILIIMETMVKTGVDRHSCYLGSTYVLCALTLVNDNTAEALPWLYESVRIWF